MVDAYSRERDERPDDRFERRGSRRGEPRFEQRLDQRLDQWVSAGRQLVDGVSGARPGSRPGARANGLKLDHLGRWVEDKLDWLLEDDDGWRESWEQQAAAGAGAVREPQPRRSRRQPLTAISRRGRAASVAAATAEEWPDEESFTLNRWQRDAEAQRQPLEPQASAPAQAGRMMPRSTRRRLEGG
ncbi:MAG: hypothetical protein FJ054_07400 [Cyanobacteria bacterium M_surface_10_m2_119]|nr:hypothetical protein [Cyanobacteria bacterium M_surface_10_m2_119]